MPLVYLIVMLILPRFYNVVSNIWYTVVDQVIFIVDAVKEVSHETTHR